MPSGWFRSFDTGQKSILERNSVYSDDGGRLLLLKTEYRNERDDKEKDTIRKSFVRMDCIHCLSLLAAAAKKIQLYFRTK